MSQAGMEEGGSLFFHLGFQLAPELIIRRWGIRQAFQESLQIKAGAAADYQGLPALDGFLNDRLGEITIIGDSVWVVRAFDVDPVMANAYTILLGWFGGPDIHSTINLHRVRGEYVGIERKGYEDGELGFAARGWSGNDNQAGGIHYGNV